MRTIAHDFGNCVTLRDLRLKYRELTRDREIRFGDTLVAHVTPDAWADMQAFGVLQVVPECFYSAAQRAEMLPGEVGRVEMWRIVVPQFIDEPEVQLPPAGVADHLARIFGLNRTPVLA